MTLRGAWLRIWLAALLLVPLPYLALPVSGQVPVVRFLFLGAVAAAYSAGVDGSGVAWTMVALLLGHALVYTAVLAPAAWLLARALPAAARGRWVWGLLAVGFAVAVAWPIYRTPFDDVAAWTRWPGLFQ